MPRSRRPHQGAAGGKGASHVPSARTVTASTGATTKPSPDMMVMLTILPAPQPVPRALMVAEFSPKALTLTVIGRPEGTTRPPASAVKGAVARGSLEALATTAFRSRAPALRQRVAR